ncbi:neuraminidase-like domain-containing protein [Pseudomonas citrulli]|uniref:Neuraminidase-like domain-containing protein n=1 Tax=Pseudomonas citrulli TaxID=3064347 RepID=A0ABT9BXJ9_9PSED|nr:neuraminidase-like domain-containing protein [Pseudomonas sp. K18]MDO7897273.1 neuraminidase-like domain-containing protein [Pseudomonas sp. K18]
MTEAMRKQLDERLREALLALYLNKVVSDDTATRLKSAQDLYDHWLLDVLVSQDVPTTPVACAIASLQQYINRILMNLEPGYGPEDVTAEHRQTWRDEMHQYATWAAHQKLLHFPATYLDPVLKANSSANFQQLENALNQSRIQPDAVQSAVLAYLARFEEVANLTVLNGYIDGEDFANGTYYFIAKSRTENTYFWRSLNMAQRPLDSTLSPPAKLDQPDPYAWSDWEKADVPIPESAVEHSIRPVWFNNRLFVVWAECIHQEPSASSSTPSQAIAATAGAHRPLLRLSYCFRKQDGSWSTPRVALQGHCEDETLAGKDIVAIKATIGTTVVHCHQGSHGYLFLALYAGGPLAASGIASGNSVAFSKTICIDKHLGLETGRPMDSAAENALLGAAAQRIQATTSAGLELVDAALPSNMAATMEDFERAYRDRIKLSYTQQESKLTLHLAADIGMTGTRKADRGYLPRNRMRLRVDNAPSQEPHLQLHLWFPAKSLPNTPYMRLDKNSFSLVHARSALDRRFTLSFTHTTDALRDDERSPSVMLSSQTDLEGKFISTQAVRHLIEACRRNNGKNTIRPSQTITLQAMNAAPLEVTRLAVLCDEPLDKQYVVFRQPPALTDRPLTYEDLTVVAESAPAEHLAPSFDVEWPDSDPGHDGTTLLFGVAFVHPLEPAIKLYSVLKAITLKRPLKRQQPPTITQVTTPGLGTTQFIAFDKSAIEASDASSRPRSPIRLNTVFAAELIRRTENSLDELFDWTTQHLQEPAIPSDLDSTMDFHGAYGRYFTELFLYVPWLVAHRLNTEHRYEEAERWLRHVFDPGRHGAECWRSVPLLDRDTPSYAHQAPHDPHQIARSHPVHFRKALYFLYLDILINRGDAAYRELTPDSLSEAKLWYVRTLDLLGPRPVVQPTDSWTDISLHSLGLANNDDLRRFENRLPPLTLSSPSAVQESRSQASLAAIDSPYLRVPFNPQLLTCWDVAESRLHNLRHNLDIAGKPLHLPVFAAPLDPRTLAENRASNNPSGAAAHLPTVPIPHYRFTVMHSQAQHAVETLSQFGATLLSLIERKEQAQLQELQQQQAWDLAKMSIDLQRQALNIDRRHRQELLASKAIVQGRASHYEKLLKDNLSDPETHATQYYLLSGASELAAMTGQITAAGMMILPNLFGFAYGGSRWEGPALAASAAAHSAAIIARTAADQCDRLAAFNRRWEEWHHAFDQSWLELAQIDAQLAHFTEQETATRLQLRLAEKTLGQAKANYDFLGKRFTKAQLYQWLNAQLAVVYRQAYDTTLGLCLAAEACWRYEMADFDRRFIQPGAWHTTYRGLGAGESLKLNLLQMQAAYLQRHERELEIRKTVSLRQLKDKTPASHLNKAWPHMHADLKKGRCEFELTHQLFEDDYLGQQHYLRRLKTISVTLPAVVGPYENIRATLTQTASTVFLAPGAGGNAMESRRANQQIALSTGVDDNGLFTLSFNDERYLPFEYTGAISRWQLTFPNPEAQKDLLESLTDVIVHVSYTARVGGGAQ